MYLLIFLLVFINLLTFHCCYGCFRNPNAENGPTINTGMMMEPLCDPSSCSLPAVNDAMVDPIGAPNAMCIYRRMVKCPMMVNIIFDMTDIFTGTAQIFCRPGNTYFSYIDEFMVEKMLTTSIECDM